MDGDGKWTPIDKLTSRMRVPGGWIVRSAQFVRHSDPAWTEMKAVALVFVPDASASTAKRVEDDQTHDEP